MAKQNPNLGMLEELGDILDETTKASFDQEDMFGHTPLTQAILNADIDTIKMLLEKGFYDPNRVDS